MTDKHNKRDTDSTWKNQIDSDVRDLSERMAGVETSLSSVSSGMNRLIESVNTVITKQSDSTKTPWANYIAAGSLFLVIIMMLGSGYVRDLDRVEEDVDKVSERVVNDPRQDQAIMQLQKDVTDHASKIWKHQGDGHPQVQQVAIDSLTSKLADLKIEAVTKEYLSAVLSANKIRLDGYGEDLHRILSWQESHDQRVVGLNSRQTENIKANKEFINLLSNQMNANKHNSLH